MSRRSTSRFLSALFALWGMLVVGMQPVHAARAQSAGLALTVRPGASDFPLALPLPRSNGHDDTAKALWDVVHRDLEMTGYFKIIDPDAYFEAGGGISPGTFDFGSWRKLMATALAKTQVIRSGTGVSADVYVYDVGAETKLTGKRFVGNVDDLRYLGHRIADEILRSLTGEPGFFGTRLAVVGDRTGSKEIYVMDVDGQGVVPVTRNGTINLSPAWSPDGRHLTWTSFKRGNPDLYVKELRTGAARSISNRPGINTGGAFSPDGKSIALARSHDGDSDIYVIDAETGATLHRLTRGGGIDVAPSWSPDGRWIAFASERSGGSQIFVSPSDGSGPARRVSFSGTFNFDPVFSPDGTQIAFVGRSGGFNVFVVDVDGKHMRPITQDQGNNEDPSWSPDGRYLVFSSDRTGRPQIWLSTSDGRHQVPITRDHGSWTQPTWSPVF